MFFAGISQYEFPISDEEVIVWDLAVINPGGCYDTLYGSYTANVHGFYHFTVQKESNNYRAMFRVFKEGAEVLYNHRDAGSANVSPVSATSFVLELQAGERVQIYNDASTIIYGVNPETDVYRSWFSGFLIYAL